MVNIRSLKMSKTIEITTESFDFSSGTLTVYKYDEDEILTELGYDDEKHLSKVDKIFVSEAIDHFGKDNILDNMDIEYIKSYLNLTEVE